MGQHIRQLYEVVFNSRNRSGVINDSMLSTALSIPAMPIEILSHIFSFLHRYKDLIAVSQCSHQLHEAVLPWLYEHIYISGGRKLRRLDAACMDGALIQESTNFLCLHTLVLLLLQRPEYARHVRRLTLKGSLQSRVGLPVDEKISKSAMTDIRIDAQLAKEIKQYTYGDASAELEWTRKISSRYWNAEAYAALLLVILPNLQSVDFCGNTTPLYRNSVLINHELNFRGTALTRLRNVMFTSDGSSYSSVGLVAEWMAIPSLRRIFAYSIHSHEDDKEVNDDENEAEETFDDEFNMTPLPTMPSPANRYLRQMVGIHSNVEHLELRDCNLNQADFVNILKIPWSLKTFIYDALIERPVMFNEHCCDLFFPTRMALSAQAHSLKNLSLDYVFPLNGPPTELLRMMAMDSLSEFGHLKHIRLPLSCLYGQAPHGLNIAQPGLTSASRLIRFLPPHIEKLHLTHCEMRSQCEYFEQGLFELLQHIYRTRHKQGHLMIASREKYNDRHRFPYLREISIEATEESFTSWHRELCSLMYEVPDLRVICLDNGGLPDPWKADRVIERKWGMDEDISWPSRYGRYARAPFPEINVKKLVRRKRSIRQVLRVFTGTVT